ncbi:hypothetical protein C8Q79DRAFT_980658 [Trametes meyenii]|nr:hypothetical protein C8Q79DRAFT_980658 [Trametes meyenii]
MVGAATMAWIVMSAVNVSCTIGNTRGTRGTAAAIAVEPQSGASRSYVSSPPGPHPIWALARCAQSRRSGSTRCGRNAFVLGNAGSRARK